MLTICCLTVIHGLSHSLSRDFSHKRTQEGHGATPPNLRPCNEVRKPRFQFMISQTNNGCSLLSLTLAKFLLVDASCENIFAFSIVTALTACPFSLKMGAKMIAFLYENRKNLLAAAGSALHPLNLSGWGLRPHTPGCAPSF